MATIIPGTPTSSIIATGLVHRPLVGVSSSTIHAMGKVGRLRCSMDMEIKPCVQENSSYIGMGVSMIAAASAVTISSPAMALVDERMSTEGTGLPFGLSNNLLGWILLGIFGLTWAFYIVYASTLEEDEDSGLSL